LKIVIGVVILLFITVTGVYTMQYYTSIIYRELDLTLVKLTDKVENHKWDRARQKTDVLEERWSSAEFFWSTFMDHQEIDLVDESIERIVFLCEMEDEKEAYIELNLARRYLYRLQEKESIDVKNIL